MAHPLFRLVAAQPQLLAEHLSSYADLLAGEWTAGSGLLLRRLALQLVGLICLAVSGTLAGVALLLWLMLPHAGVGLPWLLAAVPAAPAVLGLWAFLASARVPRRDATAVLRLHLAAYAEMLRRAAEP